MARRFGKWALREKRFCYEEECALARKAHFSQKETVSKEEILSRKARLSLKGKEWLYDISIHILYCIFT